MRYPRETQALSLAVRCQKCPPSVGTIGHADMAKITRLKQGVWLVDCRLGGRRVRRKVGSREEARVLLDCLRRAADDPEPTLSRSRAPTIGAVLDAWILHRHALTGGRKGAMRVPQQARRGLLRSIPRALPAMELSGLHLDAFIADCQERGLRPASINRDLRALRTALRWAADPGLGNVLPRLPLRVRLVPEAKINGAVVQRHVVHPEDVERLLAVSSSKLRCVLALAAFAGLRRSEILHLKRGDVDLDHGLVQIVEKPEVDWHPKAHHQRQVEIGPRLRTELDRYLSGLPAGRRAQGRWLFESQHHSGERLRQVDPQVRRSFERAGVRVAKIGLHALRKTWATRAGAMGDYEALRVMGGWSTWQAMAHYVSAGEERRRAIAEMF